MKMIGVVGGVGSYAGIDLMRKICDYSGAKVDQDHLPIAMISIPHRIQDRSRFLLNEIEENPAEGIAEAIGSLCLIGARIIGIPCNTAHAPPIFEKIKSAIPRPCKLLHLVEEVGQHIRTSYPHITRVGVLSTNGTYHSDIYSHVLSKYRLQVVQPETDVQRELVHPAMYDPEYGIKAVSNPVTQKAKDNLFAAIQHLKDKHVETIVFGCTEIPLAIGDERQTDCRFIDSTSVLAKALIRECKGKSN